MAAPLIVAAGLIAYANSYSGPFIFDDLAHIVDNPRIGNLGAIGNVLSKRRPVVDLTLAVNHVRGGLTEVGGYHATNVAIHILAALILFGLVRRSLVRLGESNPLASAAFPLALITAILWVVHPLNTQSVTYVIQRAEALMALFYLLTIYCLNRSANAPPRLHWHFLAVAACALGMGSKAVMLTAPVVAMLYDRAFLSASFAEALRRRWGLYLGLTATWIVLLVCGVVLGVLDPSRSSATVGFGFKDVSPLTYALTQTGIVLRYLSLSGWPHALCLDYQWMPADSITDVLAPLSILLLIAGVLVVLIRRSLPLAFVSAWFFLILVPTSSVVPIKDMFFEHRVYLSSAAVVLLMALGGFRIWTYVGARLSAGGSLPSWPVSVLVVAVAASLALATQRRNQDYRTRAEMWRDVTAKRPTNVRAYGNLGTALAMEGKKREAAEQYAHAVRLDPDNASARAGLGNALFETRQVEAAYEQYVEVLKLEPNNADIRVNLGHALLVMGRAQESIEAYRTASQVSPDLTTPRTLAGANFNLGSGLLQQRKLDEALAAFEESVRIWPEYAKGHFGVGRILLDLGRVDQAIVHLRKSLSINPGNTDAQRSLDEALTKKGSNRD